MREKLIRLRYTAGSSYYDRKNRELHKPNGETDRKVDFSQFLVLIAGASLLAGGIFGIKGSFIAAALVVFATFIWSKYLKPALEQDAKAVRLTWVSFVLPLIMQITDHLSEIFLSSHLSDKYKKR